MTPETNDTDDELLSAYVDGELTAEERALVEERLRTDPQARQLVEELRSLSGAIKSLPRETLGRDLRASIEAEALQAKADADQRNVLPMIGHDRWANYRRGLAWSAITIAAALMLMFVQPEQAENEMGDVAKAERRERVDRENRRSQVAGESRLPPVGEMRAAKPPQEAATRQLADGAPASTPAAGSAPAAPAPTDGLQKAKALEERESQSFAEADRAAERPASDVGALGAIGAAANMPADALDAAAPWDEAIEEKLAADKSPAQPASASLAPPATIELGLKTPDGLARFNRLLAEHNIQLEPEPEPAELSTLTRDKLVEDEASEADPSRFARSIESPAPAAVEDSADAVASLEGASTEVLVEASPEQIKELVLAFQSETETFAEVDASESRSFFGGMRSGGAAPTSEAAAAAAGRLYGYGLGGAGAPDGFGQAPTEEAKAFKKEENLGRAEGKDQTAAAGGAERRGVAPGRAWRLSVRRIGDELSGPSTFDYQSKAVDELAASGGRAGATVASPTPPAPALSGGAAPLATNGEALAKARQETSTTGQVRVLFVLRSAAVPATQPVPAGAASPSAQPAAAKP